MGFVNPCNDLSEIRLGDSTATNEGVMIFLLDKEDKLIAFNK